MPQKSSFMGTVWDFITYGFKETPKENLWPKASELSLPPASGYKSRQPRFRPFDQHERSRKIISFSQRLQNIEAALASTDATFDGTLLEQLMSDIVQLQNEHPHVPFSPQESKDIGTLQRTITALLRSRINTLAKEHHTTQATIIHSTPALSSQSPSHLVTNSGSSLPITQPEEMQTPAPNPMPAASPPPPPPPPPPMFAPPSATELLNKAHTSLQEALDADSRNELQYKAIMNSLTKIKPDNAVIQDRKKAMFERCKEMIIVCKTDKIEEQTQNIAQLITERSQLKTERTSHIHQANELERIKKSVPYQQFQAINQQIQILLTSIGSLEAGLYKNQRAWKALKEGQPIRQKNEDYILANKTIIPAAIYPEKLRGIANKIEKLKRLLESKRQQVADLKHTLQQGFEQNHPYNSLEEDLVKHKGIASILSERSCDLTKKIETEQRILIKLHAERQNFIEKGIDIEIQVQAEPGRPQMDLAAISSSRSNLRTIFKQVSPSTSISNLVDMLEESSASSKCSG